MPRVPCRPLYRRDMPVAELRAAEAFVVAVLRLWAAPHRAPAERHPDWRAGFRVAAIGEDGAAAFERLFRIVASAGRRKLDFRCQRSARLGRDEALLLQLVMLLQRGRRAEAAVILADWLPPAAARMAMMPALGLAGVLAAAGFVVPLRHCEAAEIHRRLPAAQIRGCEVVH